jgi:hypothetical protein
MQVLRQKVGDGAHVSTSCVDWRTRKRVEQPFGGGGVERSYRHHARNQCHDTLQLCQCPVLLYGIQLRELLCVA